VNAVSKESRRTEWSITIMCNKPFPQIIPFSRMCRLRRLGFRLQTRCSLLPQTERPQWTSPAIPWELELYPYAHRLSTNVLPNYLIELYSAALCFIKLHKLKLTKYAVFRKKLLKVCNLYSTCFSLPWTIFKEILVITKRRGMKV